MLTNKFLRTNNIFRERCCRSEENEQCTNSTWFVQREMKKLTKKQTIKNIGTKLSFFTERTILLKSNFSELTESETSNEIVEYRYLNHT